MARATPIILHDLLPEPGASPYSHRVKIALVELVRLSGQFACLSPSDRAIVCMLILLVPADQHQVTDIQ